MARLTNGGIVGKLTTTPTPISAVGKWNTSDQFIYKYQNLWAGDVVQSGLVLRLDAGDTSSYPGSGTTWTNIGTSGGAFTINASAYNSSGPKYMDFNGSFGCAKKTDSDFTGLGTGDVTFITWTRILNSTGNWRTLLRARSSGGDHQVINSSGGWEIGMYDNTNVTGFNGSGFSQQSIPGYGTTQWNMLVWRWNFSTAPYYRFSYNDTPGTIRGSNNSTNARFKNGICSIGAYNNGIQSDPNNASQYWGDISSCYGYNRYLTDAEVLQNFYATRTRYGI